MDMPGALVDTGARPNRPYFIPFGYKHFYYLCPLNPDHSGQNIRDSSSVAMVKAVLLLLRALVGESIITRR